MNSNILYYTHMHPLISTTSNGSSVGAREWSYV